MCEYTILLALFTQKSSACRNGTDALRVLRRHQWPSRALEPSELQKSLAKIYKVPWSRTSRLRSDMGRLTMDVPPRSAATSIPFDFAANPAGVKVWSVLERRIQCQEDQLDLIYCQRLWMHLRALLSALTV